MAYLCPPGSGSKLASFLAASPRSTSTLSIPKKLRSIRASSLSRLLKPPQIKWGKTNFCIGTAGYPEKHFEAPNLEIDLQRLKEKVDAGADYIMTQMFFDNQKFFDYVKACRDMGITVPIIPGLKPITNKKQLSVLPRIFHVDIPTELSNAISKCKTDAECEQIGTEWLIQQSKELKKFGVPVLHYYTLGKPKVIWNVVNAIV